ncbi:hypothetical protein ERX35_000975 [Macrococcus equipercicus]|uniref:Uncharacterized protein n=1 Tax=Macrococcus equipercicus TaxID=69967 RepID=A0ABQ6RB60_9STAP|nr:hypothetical protein [Macrococcus equipercicus]KAA1042485.1 hypothetical protein ERX35_000975 [Macrococcus equipercicus]
MRHLLYKEQKAVKEGKFLQTEYVCRVYPITPEAIMAFNALGYKNNEIIVPVHSFLPQEKDNMQLIENQAMNNLFRNEKKAIWNNLKYLTDYDIEIVEIINHEYNPGLTWSDIKAL